MHEKLKEAIKQACNELFDAAVEPELTRPDEKFGDYSSNAALQLGQDPRQAAEKLAGAIEKVKGVKSAEVAGPGFINIRLTDEALLEASISAADLPKPLAGQEILVEFGDPNPFKEMHIGHAYSYIVGDAISAILEASGAKVHRLSYHGDVGLQVAKAIWGMKQGKIDLNDPSYFEMGGYYAKGAQAYEKDEKAKAEIDEINRHIYAKDDAEVNKLYEWGREKSFGYFKQILKDLGAKNDRQFYESESAEAGTKLVEQNIGKVFEKSEGAIVYKGEKAGLHTRVFITSKGLPTYETKDLGLAELKKAAYPRANRSIVITAHEQSDYFKVMLAALAEIDKPLADGTTHLYHGFVSLSTGKMSSRTGDVYGAVDLISDVDQAVEKTFGKKSDTTRNAAIKYGFLKHRLGSDIVYDVTESVSLEGNSGPYLQYAHARACSILAKAGDAAAAAGANLDDSERSLARKLSEYPEVFAKASAELLPSHICTYLYELAQSFNRFYEANRVIDDEREALRLKLVEVYTGVLKQGLGLLNIDAPEKI